MGLFDNLGKWGMFGAVMGLLGAILISIISLIGIGIFQPEVPTMLTAIPGLIALAGILVFVMAIISGFISGLIAGIINNVLFRKVRNRLYKIYGSFLTWSIIGILFTSVMASSLIGINTLDIGIILQQMVILFVEVWGTIQIFGVLGLQKNLP